MNASEASHPASRSTIGRETAPVSRVHHDGAGEARRTGDAHAAHRRRSRTCRAWPRIRSRSMPTRAKASGATRARGRQRARVATRALPRGAQHLFTPADPVLVGLEHAAALAVEPHRIARIRSRTRRTHSNATN